MTNTTTLFTRIPGEDIKTSHWTYKSPEGMSIIYLHTCPIPGTDSVFYYVGSTNDSLKGRCKSDFSGYHYGLNTNSMFTKYLRKYGCFMITSKIICVVADEIRATTEQEEIERYSAEGLCFNTCRAAKEVMNPPKKYTASTTDNSVKNDPTEISVENLQLTMRHRSEPTDYVIMNKGFHQHYFSKVTLGLHTPGMKGHIYMSKNESGNRCVLTLLERDLGLKLKYGPDGCHVLTLDNLYIVGTKLSLRTFLDQNPSYIKRVSYLTFGDWDMVEN